jgi:crossover junction endodeoxyribonuclease RuvC
VIAMKVLGLDPGSRIAGFALVTFSGGRVQELELGAWNVGAAGSRSRSLGALLAAIEGWLGERRPDVAAVESPFLHRNARSALALAEARGVLLAALGAAGIEVAEYAPAAVKKTICGDGNADKERVRALLSRSVPGLERFPVADAGLDATDALAVAVCHCVHARFDARVPGTVR